LYDDLNAPQALAAFYTFVTAANRALDDGGDDVTALAEARRVFGVLNGVFDLIPVPRAVDDELASWVEQQIADRAAARASRDFAKADAIRAAIAERGVVIEDAAGKTTWKLRG
jgi:cysteinyl-tRNA synthetase